MHGKCGKNDVSGSERREARRHALVLAQVQGCTCKPSVSWHPIVVAGRRGETIRLGHETTCPRLHELRRLAAEAPLSADVVTERLL
jgi:hypothetical protein